MLTDAEKKRLVELATKKKKAKLEGAEWDEFKTLMAKSKEYEPGLPGNDFTWWNKEKDLLKDSSNILPDWIPGEYLDPLVAPTRLVGVVRYDMCPVYAQAWNATDPINLEFRDLYLRMFQKFRGINAYQYPDLGIVILSGVEIVRMIAKLERIYGVINRYSKTNFNVPEAELRALGISKTTADYIRNHMSDYRYDLNFLIKKVQRIYIPKKMSIVADSLSLFGYEYVDHDGPKAQRIIVDSNVFGIFNETRLTTGSSLIFSGSDFATIQISDSSKNMFPKLEAMIEALASSDSANKIYGDLGVWFGEEQCLSISPLPEEFTITPVYSEEILHKLHNVHMIDGDCLAVVIANDLESEDKTELGGMMDDGEYALYQYNNCLKGRLCLAETSDDYSYVYTEVLGETQGIMISTEKPDSVLIGGATVLDTFRKDFTPETVVEGLLFKPGIVPVEKASGFGAVIYSSCFHLCMEVVTYTLTADGQGATPYSIKCGDQFNEDANNSAIAAGHLSVQDWAPLTFDVLLEDNNFRVITNIFGDYDNIKVIDLNTLRRVQTATVLSGIKTELVVLSSAK